MSTLEPLPPLDHWLTLPRKEWWIRRVPMLGWMVAQQMRRSIVHAAADRAHALVAARPEVPEEAWGPDPGRRELAFFLRLVLQREIGWPADRLLPEDPMSTLCHLGRGLSLGAAVLIAIEDRLHGPIGADAWERLQTLTLDQAVDVLLPRAGRQCFHCDYSLVGSQTSICPECGTRVS